jgi:uncharacterized protein (DUF2147 family)
MMAVAGAYIHSARRAIAQPLWRAIGAGLLMLVVHSRPASA